MDVKQLKDACNAKYAQAIAGMEQGEQISCIARNLLDAAGLLVKISEVDFSLSAVCRERAERLLSAARSLRIDGDVSSVYFNLTGKRLAIFPQAEKTEEKPVEGLVSADGIPAGNASDEKEEDVPAEKEKFVPVMDEEDTQLIAQTAVIWSTCRACHSEACRVTAGYRFAWDNIPKISFDDVAGLDDVKEAVMRKVLLPLKNPELY